MFFFSFFAIYYTCLAFIDYKSQPTMYSYSFTVYKGVKYLFTLEK